MQNGVIRANHDRKESGDSAILHNRFIFLSGFIRLRRVSKRVAGGVASDLPEKL
jgi:hypothetical protein